MSSPIDLNLSAPYQKRIAKANPQLSNALEIELAAFRFGTEHGRFFHMERLVDFLFTKEHNPEIINPVRWNPWTRQICQTLCDGVPSLGIVGYPFYTGITGPASSSKTYSVALYVFLLWYSNPNGTKGIVSSTSIQSAKNRIWGEVVQFANSVPDQVRNYDVLTSNPAMIRVPGSTHKETIELIAGDDSQTEASAKVLGIKNKWVILAVDEATEVSHALFTARENLNKNIRFQMIFIGNAKSHDDPHGKLCEPEKGWDSISVESPAWRTVHNRGVCIHLDGIKSPNLSVPRHPDPTQTNAPFPGLFDYKDLDDILTTEGGENTGGYVRFTRGFWAKAGQVRQIYSKVDIELNGGMEKPIWREPPIRLIGHDVAFASDGDKSPAVIGELGFSPEGIPMLSHLATELVEVDDSKPERRSYAMAARLKEIRDKYEVQTHNIGVDCTGTGVSYPEIVDEVLKGRCTRIAFNGPVSDLPYPSDGLTEAQEMFDRRVSEIWYIARLYLEKGQLRGLQQSLVNDMCKRLYDRVKQNKISVETKRKMRERGVHSPDEADAYFIMLDLARSRHGFEVWKGKVKAGPVFPRPKRSFKDWAAKTHPKAKLLINMPSGGWQQKTITHSG